MYITSKGSTWRISHTTAEWGRRLCRLRPNVRLRPPCVRADSWTTTQLCNAYLTREIG